jgi:hypothetical protein
VVCLQETKRGSFDSSYLRNFCPRYLSKFEFFPSYCASCGLITIWNPSLFDGSLVLANAYSVTAKLTCVLIGKTFCLSNIYGPCATAERAAFIIWLYNLDNSDFDV